MDLHSARDIRGITRANLIKTKKLPGRVIEFVMVDLVGS